MAEGRCRWQGCHAEWLRSTPPTGGPVRTGKTQRDPHGAGVKDLEFDLDVDGAGPEQRKLCKAVGEFGGYLRANAASIPNYGERYRAGEVISSSLAESTINQVVSKRMVKKQQMRWTPRGAHLLLQVRTRVLNDDLADQFRRWHPGFTHTIEGSPAGLAVAA
jgi:hypothetical protein